MKQITFNFLASLVVFMLVVGTTACSKKDNDSGIESDKITLQVNGASYEPYLIQDIDIGFGINIVGSFSDGQHSLVIILDSDAVAGSYDLSNLDLNYGILWDDVININTGNIERYTSKSGSITIEEFNEETGLIKGTFDAICKTTDDKTITITNGTFTIHI